MISATSYRSLTIAYLVMQLLLQMLYSGHSTARRFLPHGHAAFFAKMLTLKCRGHKSGLVGNRKRQQRN